MNPKLAQLALILYNYDFHFVFRSRRNNCNVNGLSSIIHPPFTCTKGTTPTIYWLLIHSWYCIPPGDHSTDILSNVLKLYGSVPDGESILETLKPYHTLINTAPCTAYNSNIPDGCSLCNIFDSYDSIFHLQCSGFNLRPVTFLLYIP